MISFEAIFEQSTPNSPIVFILSPGSDPASDLMKLAERSGFGGNRLKFLAMGLRSQALGPLQCLQVTHSFNLGLGFRICKMGVTVPTSPSFHEQLLHYNCKQQKLEERGTPRWLPIPSSS